MHVADREICVKFLVNRHSVWRLGAAESVEYQEKAKEGQPSVFDCLVELIFIFIYLH
jgi:hypothetical protein